MLFVLYLTEVRVRYQQLFESDVARDKIKSNTLALILIWVAHPWTNPILTNYTTVIATSTLLLLSSS